MGLLLSYPLSAHIDPVTPAALTELRRHYNHFMCQSLLTATKASLNALKKRVASRHESTIVFVEQPFFEVPPSFPCPSSLCPCCLAAGVGYGCSVVPSSSWC